ncbi:SulP family inorganic anion transporter [Mesorhizobium sp. LjNodule214]|uniref:SulP family inorganic anion transporter n=1 Tax=Mesorhizobium sp. LjNodule214 TaxID=3342252 RepID=UPI003ECC6DE5
MVRRFDHCGLRRRLHPFVLMIVYALLGTSRVLSVSSTTTLAILAGTQLGLAVPDGNPDMLITATATLTALTGALLIGAFVLRLGFIANFISSRVLTGFKAGIGLVIALDQVPKLLGLHIAKEGFLRDILSVAHHLPDASLLTLTIAIAAMLALLAMERFWPHSPQGIVVAIVLSLVGLASQSANPNVYVIGRKRGTDIIRPLSPEHPDDETVEGLLILRPEGRLFFANAQRVADRIQALVVEHKPRVLALDLSRVFDIEYSALQMLMEGERRITEQGMTCWMVALNPSVLEYIRASGFADRLGPERLFSSVRGAIQHYTTSFNQN